MPPSAMPPRDGDPESIGGHRIVGRLGAGGQGVVYLAETEAGDLVAVKTLHGPPDEVDAARFRREAEVLPRVASFCTAQVLTTGTAGGRPYIVSEYIEGPSLQQAVRERGPLRGRELRRLAIGTITALAAIHRAGVVHRDFKPGNVLLGADGPRVIDFGIARAVGGEATGGGPVGTPSYMAPEQFDDVVAGPAADLFSWGATMAFAANGHPPFGADAVAAVVRRVLSGEPDVGTLDGDLRDLVTECLDKDPSRRPRASEVLLRLLGRPAGPPHSGRLPGTAAGAPPSDRLLAEGAGAPPSDRLLAEGAAEAGEDSAPAQARSPTRPSGPSRARAWRRAAMGAGALAVALTATVTVVRVYAPAEPAARPRPAATTPAPPRLSGAPAVPASTVSVPGLNAVFREHPSDPYRLTSFHFEEKGKVSRPAYVRDPGAGTFHRLTEYRDPVVSPDGATIASVYSAPKFASENNNDVEVTDRATGARHTIPTVDLPLVVRTPQWSPDGRRLLLTAVLDEDDSDEAVGFVVVDLAARGSRLVRVAAPGTGTAAYVWLPDGSGVIRRSGRTGVRAYDLGGRVLRSYQDVIANDSSDQWFSPSGRRLITVCPGKATAACVLDAGTGARQARVALPDKSVLWGWWNEDHLLVYRDGHAGVVDLNGKEVRPLADIGHEGPWLLHFTRTN
ncbi:putative Ser/Thr protein kinase [Nonomuraea thailandensis]|uniref:Ser/Thr protein kinase n=1 Tax=Nonomuraea thailandensis TaxID=1188745 RepID=A0A9X2GLS9_9ACTN|nr:protein kinase [Nonomuraea thailandensis]MCP2360072.1 putative Ser/Thr protein kinase [Nonomuraea thailandensis]